MQLPIIKSLVEKYTIETLTQAEEDMLEGNDLKIQVDGKDEGEQLTHISAAIWIKNTMAEKNIPYNQALREFTQKVRNSIS